MMLTPSEFGCDSTGAHLCVWVIVVFFVHRTALLGTQTGTAHPVDPILPDKEYPAYPNLGFWALMVGYIAAIFGFGFIVFPIIDQNTGGNLSADKVFLLYIIGVAILIWLLFSALGTAIPAGAIAHQAGLWRALRRARYTFWRTAGWLLVGPGLIYGLGFGLLAAADAAGLHANLPGTIAGLRISDILDYLVINTLVVGLATSTVAATLSHSYLIGEKRIAAQEASVQG